MDKITLALIAFMLIICCLGHHFAQKDNIKNAQNLTNLDNYNSYQGSGGEFKGHGAGGSW